MQPYTYKHPQSSINTSHQLDQMRVSLRPSNPNIDGMEDTPPPDPKSGSPFSVVARHSARRGDLSASYWQLVTRHFYKWKKNGFSVLNENGSINCEMWAQKWIRIPNLPEMGMMSLNAFELLGGSYRQWMNMHINVYRTRSALTDLMLRGKKEYAKGWREIVGTSKKHAYERVSSNEKKRGKRKQRPPNVIAFDESSDSSRPPTSKKQKLCSNADGGGGGGDDDGDENLLNEALYQSQKLEEEHQFDELRQVSLGIEQSRKHHEARILKENEYLKRALAASKSETGHGHGYYAGQRYYVGDGGGGGHGYGGGGGHGHYPEKYGYYHGGGGGGATTNSEQYGGGKTAPYGGYHEQYGGGKTASYDDYHEKYGGGGGGGATNSEQYGRGKTAPYDDNREQYYGAEATAPYCDNRAQYYGAGATAPYGDNRAQYYGGGAGATADSESENYGGGKTAVYGGDGGATTNSSTSNVDSESKKYGGMDDPLLALNKRNGYKPKANAKIGAVPAVDDSSAKSKAKKATATKQKERRTARPKSKAVFTAKKKYSDLLKGKDVGWKYLTMIGVAMMCVLTENDDDDDKRDEYLTDRSALRKVLVEVFGGKAEKYTITQVGLDGLVTKDCVYQADDDLINMVKEMPTTEKEASKRQEYLSKTKSAMHMD